MLLKKTKPKNLKIVLAQTHDLELKQTSRDGNANSRWMFTRCCGKFINSGLIVIDFMILLTGLYCVWPLYLVALLLFIIAIIPVFSFALGFYITTKNIICYSVFGKTPKSNEKILPNIYFDRAWSKERNINLGTYQVILWIPKKKKKTIFKYPISNVFSMTLAFWLTLLQK